MIDLGGSPELRQYWDIVVRRKWVVYTVAAALLALAALRTFSLQPLYRATALLEIQRATPDVTAFRDILRTDPTWQGYNAFFETQYRILASRSVARLAAQSLRLDPAAAPVVAPGLVSRVVSTVARALPRFHRASAAPAEPFGPAIDLLLAGVSVHPVHDSQLVEVSFVSPDPGFASRAANAVTDAYIEFSLTNQFDTTEQASDFLSRRVGELRDEVAALEGQLQSYREARRILPGPPGSGLEMKGVTALDDLELQARARRIAAEASWSAARQSDPASLTEVVGNETVGRLQGEINDLEIQRAEMLRTFTAEWPQVQALTRRLEGARQRLAAETQAVAARVVAGAEAKYRASLDEEQRLDALLATQKDSAQRAGRDAIEHATLMAEVERKRAVLNALLQRQSEASVNSQMREMNAGQARVVDRALPPPAPFRPRVPIDLMIGAVVGLLAGLGAAFGVESWDNTLRRPEQVEQALHLPTLARIPTAQPAPGSGPARGPDTDLLSHREPASPLAESFRDLRTALSLSTPGAAPRLLSVTSSRPEEGKSTVAVNLATVLAQAGRSVLLVDSDLRRPRLHRVFGLRHGPGLSAVLCRKATLDESVHATEVAGLSVMTSGAIPPNPAELLDSPSFDELVAEALRRFDAIVFDSAPLLSVTDGAILSAHVDGTILVIESDRTAREEARRAFEKLRRINARVLGVVLNHAPESEAAYRYRYDATSTPQTDASHSPRAAVRRFFQRRAR